MNSLLFGEWGRVLFCPPSRLTCHAVVGVWVGVHCNETTTALVMAAWLLGLGGAATLTAGGSVLSHLVLGCCLMGMTALHIQLGRADRRAPHCL